MRRRALVHVVPVADRNRCCIADAQAVAVKGPQRVEKDWRRPLSGTRRPVTSVAVPPPISVVVIGRVGSPRSIGGPAAERPPSGAGHAWPCEATRQNLSYAASELDTPGDSFGHRNGMRVEHQTQ